MSEIPARYGNPLPPAPKPDPRNERPDNRVLREYLEELEKSKSSGTASTPTSGPGATSTSSARKPGPYKTSDE